MNGYGWKYHPLKFIKVTSLEMRWNLEHLKTLNTGIRSRGILILWITLCFLFGVAYLLTPVFNDKNPQPVQYLDFFIGLLIFSIPSAILFWLSQWNWSEKKSLCSPRKTFLISFSLIVLMGVFYLIVYYPGTGMIDTLNILISKDLFIADQHPWVYVLFTQYIVKLVNWFGGGFEASLVVLSLIQIFLTAVVFSYCIVWLQKKGLAPLALVPIAAFLIFCPFLDIAMISIFKDMLFSLLMLAWMPILYDCWQSDGKILLNKGVLAYLALLIILCLVRNNGIYVAFLLLLCFSFTIPWKYKKQILTLWIVLVCTVAGNSFFEKSFHITHLFKETVGIPLQQIGGVVYYNGKLSADDEDFINGILPLTYIEEHYSPYDSNELKWGSVPINDQFLNEHKTEFLMKWIKLFFRNPKIYIETYLKNTYGFWSLDNTEKLRSYTTIYVDDPPFDKWFEKENIRIKDLLPEPIQTPLEKFLTAIADFVGEGTSFWTFIIVWIAFGLKNGPKSLLVGSPIIANWLTIMVATPLAFQYRYVLCTIMGIPVLLGMLLLAHGSLSRKEISAAEFVEFALEENPNQQANSSTR